MKQKGLKKNLILSTFYQILTMVLPLITAPYVARVLGVNGTGIYSYTHSYSMYFCLLGALGTVSYGTREIARHREDKAERSRLFWEIALLTIITSFICICAWGVWILFNQIYKIYYLILTITLLGTMFDVSWFFAGMEEFKYTVTQNSLFKLMGAVSIFIFVKQPEDLWIYVLILSLSVFLANISMWIYLPRFIQKTPIKSLKIQRHVRETLVYFVPTIATSVYTILDKTLIGLITQDTSENGNYEQATKIVNIAKSVCFTGINLVLQSRISYLFAEKKYEEIKDRIEKSMDYILFVGIAICCGLIGIAERFVPLYFGSGYEKTIILLQMMAPLVVIIGISNCLGSQYYNPAGLRAKSAKFIIIGSVTNLVLNLLLIPYLKSIGAVIATICAEITISILYLHFCDGYYVLNNLLKSSWKKIAAGLVMLGIVVFIGKEINNAFISVALQCFCGAFIYFVILYILKDSFMIDVIIPQMKGIISKVRK